MRPQANRGMYTWSTRGLALLACVALLYFAAGGSFLHKHSAGQDQFCSVCQTAHAPALAAESTTLIATPETLGRVAATPKLSAPLNAFALHQAGRAPPTA